MACRSKDDSFKGLNTGDIWKYAKGDRRKFNNLALKEMRGGVAYFGPVKRVLEGVSEDVPRMLD